MGRIWGAVGTRASARRAAAVALVVSFSVCIDAGGAAQSERRRQERVAAALAREGAALARLADDAANGRSAPADFTIGWRHDFFKADPGTFVPFTVTFDTRGFHSHNALMFVRAERAAPRTQGGASAIQYETIFPLTLPGAGATTTVRRGFAVPPGAYRVTVVIREAPGEADRDRRASVLVKDIDVPDFWTGTLTTSTIVVADRLERLAEPVAADELDEDPYVVGDQRIHPAEGRVFARNRELIVVFLVYNPSFGADKHFDVQVDYHLYRQDPGSAPQSAGDHPPARAGERYVTRTNPQRFNPSLMGTRFDPSSGTPVLAGQGILLSAFEPGDYRLAITVTDLLSRNTVARDVAFTVIGS